VVNFTPTFTEAVSSAAGILGRVVVGQIVQGHVEEAFSEVVPIAARASSLLKPSFSLPPPHATSVAQLAAMSVVRILHLMNLFILMFMEKRIEMAGSLPGAAF
jgi:hypothetical protein